MPHQGDPGDAKCSAEEKAYLLDAYNRYFADPRGPPPRSDIVYSWSGVRALHDDTGRKAEPHQPKSRSCFCRKWCGRFRHYLWRQAHHA
jgi:glycerol-3-phosphate dehydrogenase